jgi:hypothetical protein
MPATTAKIIAVASLSSHLKINAIGACDYRHGCLTVLL